MTGREILVHGKSFGTVTLVVWSKSGQRNFYNITVEQNLEPLRKLLKDTFPQEDIHVQSSRDSLSLTGHVSGKDAAERATALATPFGKTWSTIYNSAAAGRETDSAASQVRRTRPQQGKPVCRQSHFHGRRQHDRAHHHGTIPGALGGSINGTIGAAAQGTTSSFTISDALNIFAFQSAT